MTTPNNNIPPDGNHRKTVDDIDSEPVDDRTGHQMSERSTPNEKKTVHLEQLLTIEIKKSALSQIRAAAAAKTIKSLKGRLQSSDASHIAAIKRLKGHIAGLKIREKSALEAASTSSKIVDDATKEVIGNKAGCIRDLRKEIVSLQKQIRDGSGLERQVSRLNSDIIALVKEKSELKTLHQNATKEVKLLNKKVNDQTDAKYAHQQKMAEIALEGKQVTLAQGRQKKLNLEAKNQKVLQQRKEFQTWTYAQRGLQKEKELLRKEELKDKKSKKVAERLQVVSSDMLRTNRINGGAFPNPGLSLQEVSRLFLRRKNLMSSIF
jgi:hypothetical protein